MQKKTLFIKNTTSEDLYSIQLTYTISEKLNIKGRFSKIVGQRSKIFFLH